MARRATDDGQIPAAPGDRALHFAKSPFPFPANSLTSGRLLSMQQFGYHESNFHGRDIAPSDLTSVTRLTTAVPTFDASRNREGQNGPATVFVHIHGLEIPLPKLR